MQGYLSWLQTATVSQTRLAASAASTSSPWSLIISIRRSSTPPRHPPRAPRSATGGCGLSLALPPVQLRARSAIDVPSELRAGWLESRVCRQGLGRRRAIRARWLGVPRRRRPSVAGTGPVPGWNGAWLPRASASSAGFPASAPQALPRLERVRALRCSREQRAGGLAARHDGAAVGGLTNQDKKDIRFSVYYEEGRCGRWPRPCRPRSWRAWS